MTLNPDAVKTKDDLIAFLVFLRSDLKTNRNDWENPTLEMFLEAMEAWLSDSATLPITPEWHTFANILLAGKSYE